MLLFRGEGHIQTWCSQWNQPRGARLTIEQAWRLANAWYRNKMSADWRRATLDETEAILMEIGLTGPFWSLRS